MLITARKDTRLTTQQLEHLRRALMRPPENPMHAQVLLRAVQLLSPEITLDEMRVQYNAQPVDMRGEWVAGVIATLDEYEESLNGISEGLAEAQADGSR